MLPDIHVVKNESIFIPCFVDRHIRNQLSVLHSFSLIQVDNDLVAEFFYKTTEETKIFIYRFSNEKVAGDIIAEIEQVTKPTS